MKRVLLALLIGSVCISACKKGKNPAPSPNPPVATNTPVPPTSTVTTTDTPTSSATDTVTATRTPTGTSTSTATSTPSGTSTRTSTATSTPTRTSTATATPTATSTATSTPTGTWNHGHVTTLAGQAGVSGSANGTGTAASFISPGLITIDSTGNLYVMDSINRVRKVTSSGVVSTVYVGGGSGYSNYGIATDSMMNIFVSNPTQDVISKMPSGGSMSTFAGYPDYVTYADGVGTNARFYSPMGLAVDSLDNIFVADASNGMIRKITPGAVVSTFVGSGTFTFPVGVAVDAYDNVYVTSQNIIRKISPGGTVSTMAGQAAVTGCVNGVGTAALFNRPLGIAVDSNGNVYVADKVNQVVRKITPSGVVSTLAGQAGVPGYSDGDGTAAKFNYPDGIAVDSSGAVYVADTGNNLIRMIQ